MKKTLMKIYDERYDEIFGKILLKVSDREVTKKVMGEIFSDTWDKVAKKKTNGEGVKSIFSEVMQRHGISE